MENNFVKKYNYEMKCITCGKRFESNRSTAKYCSSFCKQKQNDIQKKGVSIKFRNGLAVAEAKPYQKKKTTRKKELPQNARLIQTYSYWLRDGKFEMWTYNASPTAIEKDDIMRRCNKGAYVYAKNAKNKTKTMRQIVRTIGDKTVQYDYKLKKEYYQQTCVCKIYEWTITQVQRKNNYKHYYDEPVQTIEIDEWSGDNED